VSVDFLAELRRREESVRGYLAEPRFRSWFSPESLQQAVYAYVERGGKCLRPTLLLFSCGAVGGDEQKALPAAAGIEVFHTWTLVHDDLIDHDDRRRGGPSVHALGRRIAEDQFRFTPDQAAEYGNDLAILAGDVQQGWAVSLLTELLGRGVPAEVVVSLIKFLESSVVNAVIGGELLDVELSFTPIERVGRGVVLHMMALKTASLLEYAAMAGAIIGLNTSDSSHPTATALAQFAGQCGMAFQLQDDALGLVGDERLLGKPVGSDIREGKRTVIVCRAFETAGDSQRILLKRVLGNRDASDRDIEDAIQVLIEVGAVDYARQLAGQHIDQAMERLEAVPSSGYKELLRAWADFMVRRRF